MLLNIAKEVAPPKMMQISESINQWNIDNCTDIKILLLPIAHPQLNPIELVWSWVKTEVGKKNTDFKMSTVKATKTLERINEITPEMWRSSCLKSDEHARQYMEVDDMDDNADDENDMNDDEHITG